MPFGDGTGPTGQGPGTGRRRNRMGGNHPGRGHGGYCICSSCGKRLMHQPGVPCSNINCPQCGVKMVRE